ncbi:MAG: lysyl-tRNA synthetase, class [Actinomycetota bacterium]|jgi:lysylphosphatidylglycerol synthetase-like protein (DUF2156 family)|nr:lysyl-tRNA synthetase, class [Actinomycetota bacterium]
MKLGRSKDHPTDTIVGVARVRRTRRWAAVAIALAGVLDVASAVTPPLRDRLGEILNLVPLAVPVAASAIVAIAGLALLLLARGVRRGQRHAWQISIALLAGSSLLHIVKGGDLEEALAALVVCGYLISGRSAFRVAADRPSVIRGFATLLLGGALAVAAATVAVEAFPGHTMHRLPWTKAVLAVTERLAGIQNIALSDRAGDFLNPGLLAVGISLVVFAGWLVFAPRVAQRLHGTAADDHKGRARNVVKRYGGDTLAYFALRDDKEHFFWGESVVAYGVWGSICLVSPDPIGPVSERARVWQEFHRFADDHGWAIAVMGAGDDWLPVYKAAGMKDIYTGDEAVVDCKTFSCDGGRFKGLRQAVNRIAKYGYKVKFYDPAKLDPVLETALRHVLTQSRRGEVERGFSMTLGRVFDKADEGLLLAVCFGPTGHPVAFCQFVPAPGINGFSLDLMRRDQGEHPNGVTDFIVVETIRHLQARGMDGLGLNFATMRAVLAGEKGDTVTQKVERWLLKRMSDSMQIESLWRYNAKFAPTWRARFACYESPESFLPAALAVARAESFWELPVIGRFLVPDGPEPVGVSSAPSDH